MRYHQTTTPVAQDAPTTACQSLLGQNVLVTGGTRGLGYSTAARALECGANHVTITSRPPDRGGSLADRDEAMRILRQKFPGRIAHQFADVRVECAVAPSTGAPVDDGVCNARVFDPVLRTRLGLPRVLDGVVLNAGIFGPGDTSRYFTKLKPSAYADVMATNCEGVARGLRDYAHAQQQAPSVKHPAAVVLTSIYSEGSSLFSNYAYTASKGCARSLVHHAAVEFARPEGVGLPAQIRVNGVAPGFVKTPLSKGFWQQQSVRNNIAEQHPTGEWVAAQAVADAVVDLVRPNLGITGSNIRVDNGIGAEARPIWKEARTIRALTGEPCCGGDAQSSPSPSKIGATAPTR